MKYIFIFFILLCSFSCNFQSVESKSTIKHIGMMIRDERLQQGISQKNLAEAVGLDLNTLSLIEDGLAVPVPEKVNVISAYLGKEFALDSK